MRPAQSALPLVATTSRLWSFSWRYSAEIRSFQVTSVSWGTMFVLNRISLSVQNMEMQNELKHWETMTRDNKVQIWQEGRKGLKGPKLWEGSESLRWATSPLKSPFAHSPSRDINAFEWYDLCRLSPSPHPFRHHQWQLLYATRLEEILKTIPC